MSLDINRILNKDRVPCKYGAPLGQQDTTEIQVNAPLHLQRVRWVDGDYTPDGTYWGRIPGHSMWVAFNGADDPEWQPSFGTRIWAKARNRKEAAALIREHYPDVKFIKEPK